MEDIKTSFDKIMAQFNDSSTHCSSKKLNFEYLNDSVAGTSSAAKKRRISDTKNDTTPCETSANNTSLNSSVRVPPSPWEIRRVKTDLMEAQTKISNLTYGIDRQNKITAEKEALYEKKISELMKQCDFSTKKVADCENHLEVVRKREFALKRELNKTQKEMTEMKNTLEEKLRKLERAKSEGDELARHTQSTMANELGETRRTRDKLQMELGMKTDELEAIKKSMEEFKLRASAYDELKQIHEKTQQELECSNSRVKELEYKIASYDDWKEITKSTQSRLVNIVDMTREMERLKESNKRLQALIGNKLLLEEQVHDLKTRLEKEDGARTEVVSLQVKLNNIEQELKEWIKVAQDHCLPNSVVSAMSLRSRIEQLLQNDLIATCEKGTKLAETKCKESELLDYKQKCEIYVKNYDELNIALKRHKNFKDRLQKKLLLISKERDCYKQLLENMEKDLTVSNVTTSDSSGMEMQLRARVDMLEKTLAGYKEMCENMSQESGMDQAFGITSESYDHLKKELSQLRIEKERLQRRKDELELELEHRCLRGDFNNDKYKVVHFNDNPAMAAYENTENQVEKLQAQVERLKRRVQQLEESEATQMRLNETSNVTVQIREMNQLRSDLESTTAKMKKMKEYFKSANTQFREVCYLLFGYRIDCSGMNCNYRLSSMYAENEDDYLSFVLNESNGLSMLETKYSATIQPLMESQLMGNKSLPVFLSSLTLELFQRSTRTINIV